MHFTDFENMKIAYLLTALLMVASAAAINWQSGNDGQVMWAQDCDFYGNDIGSQASRPEDCGGVCLSKAECTHFTHTDGVCYMKKAVNPEAREMKGAVCGWATRRQRHVQYSIRAGETPARGVNLGGWLVTEYWINSGDELWRGVSPEVSRRI